MTINLVVHGIDADVSTVDGAIIDFDPSTLTNNSINRLPSWTAGGNTYSLTASDNFNWSTDRNGGGYKEDTDGKCFVIKAGTYVDLDYKMFKSAGGSNEVFETGAEMKIIFKTAAVRNAEAVWFSNVGTFANKPVGIQLGAHYGWLKTDKASDTSVAIESEYSAWESNIAYSVDALVVYKNVIYKCIAAITANTEAAATNPKDNTTNWLKMGAVETETLATNSYLYFPYSENDKIELDININKYNSAKKNNFIMSYEDGVPSKAYAYTYGSGGDGLRHTEN